MDQFLEPLLENFFTSLLTKLKDSISSVEHRISTLGSAIGQTIGLAIIKTLWSKPEGQIILLVFGLWSVYIVRMFVHDMLAVYALATEYWRLTMFLAGTAAIGWMVTRTGEGVVAYDSEGFGEGELVEIDEQFGEVDTLVSGQGENVKVRSSMFWWTTTSVKKSNGKTTTTTTRETATLKVSQNGKKADLDAHKNDKRTKVQKLMQEKIEREDKSKQLVEEKRPSRLVPADKGSTVQLSADGRSTFAAGLDPQELEMGLQLRSDVPFATDKLAYFEARLGIKDPEGWIGIGMCTADSATTGMPGWFEGSYAYHGDDGTFFKEAQEGKVYGPTYGMFDVIGCGVDYEKNEMFFTKNGEYLGKALAVPKGKLFAVVGLGYKGARFSVNFGETRFHYNR